MKTHRIGAIFVLSIGVTVAAHAQATRTWVSGVGDDVNPCSRTAPCKTWAGAISKTAAGGEIDALDPGGFGQVTITKSITLDGGGGVMASILSSVTNAVNINWNPCNTCNPPDSAGHITLRNLTLNGGTTGLHGVNIINNGPAEVTIENCRIFNFQTAGNASRGVKIATNAGNTKVTVMNTSIRNISGEAIESIPNGGSIDLTVDGVHISQVVQSAIDLDNNTDAVIANSVITNNGAAALYVERASCTANVYHSVLSRNGYGLYIGDSGGGTIRLYGSQIADNITSGIQILGGTVATHGNNAIFGNGGTQATNLTINQQ